MRRTIPVWVWAVLGSAAVASLAFYDPVSASKAPAARVAIPITISSAVPSELNAPYSAGPPETGGARNATPEQAAAFAWQEFIALNWPAGPQTGQNGQRDTPSSTCRFDDPLCTGPLTWETLRGKVETFPGDDAAPHGYVNDANRSYGYDDLPRYNYHAAIAACVPSQANDPVPWINLDETDEINLNSMYAGVGQTVSSPSNTAPKLIRFLAKSNRRQFVYVAARSSDSTQTGPWWRHIPSNVNQGTRAYLNANLRSPPPGSTTMVSQLNGTIEIKAGWRPLTQAESRSGRFHTQMVRFYERDPQTSHLCYVDQVWGLVALHIIQKTPSAPYFIYATFEQADNILTANGTRVEDENGRIVNQQAAANTPQVCLRDPRPTGSGTNDPSKEGSVIPTTNTPLCLAITPPLPLCATPGMRLYYENIKGEMPDSNNEPLVDGNGNNKICVDKRENAIPDYAIAANVAAHAAMRTYLDQTHQVSAPWLAYKLINVQYFPYDKVITTPRPNGSLYNAEPPYSATKPPPSSYYLANIVVETNRSLQLFSGGLSPNISTDWNMNGTQHKNTIYGGLHFNMGGCMGCHGSQGQTPPDQGTGDFSVILARGAVRVPQIPDVPPSKK